MSLDIIKLKEQQDRLNAQALKEIFEELPDGLLKIVSNSVINYSLQEAKSRKKDGVSARVLHNWASQDVIDIDPSDKGKIRKFSRLESIWLSLVLEARRFGVPLGSLKQARKDLFNSPIKDFSLLKFCVLDSILRKPKILIMSDEGTVRQFSPELYQRWTEKNYFPPHLSLNLLNYIALEFPNNLLTEDFQLNSPFDDANKLKLLYFLKTGDYDEIKVFVTETDVRLIDNSKVVLNNNELSKILYDWKFLKLEIIINEKVEALIELKV